MQSSPQVPMAYRLCLGFLLAAAASSSGCSSASHAVPVSTAATVSGSELFSSLNPRAAATFLGPMALSTRLRQLATATTVDALTIRGANMTPLTLTHAGGGLAANGAALATLTAQFPTLRSLWHAVGLDPASYSAADFNAGLTALGAMAAKTGIFAASLALESAPPNPPQSRSCMARAYVFGSILGLDLRGPDTASLDDINNAANTTSSSAYDLLLNPQFRQFLSDCQNIETFIRANANTGTRQLIQVSSGD